MSVEWVTVLIAIVAVGVTTTVAVVAGFRRLDDRINEGLAEAARERAAGFANAAEQRATGFAEAARERAAGFANAAQERTTGFAEAAQERTAGFAEAARERAEIRERLARLEGTLDVLRSYFAPRQRDEGAA